MNRVFTVELKSRNFERDEIANAILFLLKNSSISGQLWADAGWHPRA